MIGVIAAVGGFNVAVVAAVVAASLWICWRCRCCCCSWIGFVVC